MDKVIFHPEQIEFEDYSFRIASVAKNPLLNASYIKEVRLNRWPLEVLTNTGEVLFIPTYHEKHLDLFARINNLLITEREDVWSLINEPFLDTQFEDEEKQQTIQRLHDCGFSLEEIIALRKKISVRMLDFNAVKWDWVHLGHYDVLSALGYSKHIQFFSAHIHLFRKKAKARYDEFNAISNRGRIIDPVTIPIGEKLENSIRDLTYDIIPFSTNELIAKQLIKSDPRENLIQELTDLVTCSYGQKHRHHHTLEHVLSVVEYCESLFLKVEKDRRIPLRLAAFFHDIVYEPDSDKNEESSAKLMYSKLEEWVDNKDLEIANKLILMTKTHFKAKSDYEKILSDADLSILAEEESVYKKYAQAIRQEYSHISDATFNAGRIEFLETVLKHIGSAGHLFHYLHPLHESQALKNLTAERDELIKPSIK